MASHEVTGEILGTAVPADTQKKIHEVLMTTLEHEIAKQEHTLGSSAAAKPVIKGHGSVHGSVGVAK